MFRLWGLGGFCGGLYVKVLEGFARCSWGMYGVFLKTSRLVTKALQTCQERLRLRVDSLEFQQKRSVGVLDIDLGTPVRFHEG